MNIDINNSNNENEYKKTLILQKIKDFTQEIIIKEIVEYIFLQLNNYQYNFTQIEKDIIEAWWE